MEKKNKYYVVRDKALPEVLQKVVEVKRLLEADKNLTVQEAAEQVGLSRSSFYKYKDDILPFSDNTRGKTVTLVTQMIDEPGLLSDLLHIAYTFDSQRCFPRFAQRRQKQCRQNGNDRNHNEELYQGENSSFPP